MNSLCKYNPTPTAAARMAHGSDLAVRPSATNWMDVFATNGLFILNGNKDIRRSRHGCRMRLSLKT